MPCNGNCEKHGPQPCPYDGVTDTIAEIHKTLASMDRHITDWIGNDRPGFIPVQLSEMKTKVDAHETYIVAHQAAEEAVEKVETVKQKFLTDRRLMWASIIGSTGTAVGVLYHILSLARAVAK